MKKHLIAASVAAALAAPAMAQNVEIYGVLDRAIVDAEQKVTVRATGVTTEVSTRTTGGGGNGSTQGVNSVTSNPSMNYTTERLGFRGTEDLGGGLKAHFNLELRISGNDQASGSSAERTDPFSQRIAMVGLSGNFGRVDIGRQTTAIETAWGAGDAGNGNNFWGRIYVGQRATQSRNDRLVSYTTPVMSGFSAQVQYGVRDDDSTTGAAVTKVENTETGLSLRYAQGPLNVNFGYQNYEIKSATATTSELDAKVLGASYNFGPARAFVTYVDTKNKAGVAAIVNNEVNKRKGYELGVQIPVGSLTIHASAYDGDFTATATSPKRNFEGYQIGALYALSKRTTLYAVYGSEEGTVGYATSTSGTVGISGAVAADAYTFDRNVLGLGVRHTF